MNIVQRMETWIGARGKPTRRADPDQELEWLLVDALDEIARLRHALSDVGLIIADADYRLAAHRVRATLER